LRHRKVIEGILIEAGIEAGWFDAGQSHRRIGWSEERTRRIA
jgi:hypothetical protein